MRQFWILYNKSNLKKDIYSGWSIVVQKIYITIIALFCLSTSVYGSSLTDSTQSRLYPRITSLKLLDQNILGIVLRLEDTRGISQPFDTHQLMGVEINEKPASWWKIYPRFHEKSLTIEKLNGALSFLEASPNQLSMRLVHRVQKENHTKRVEQKNQEIPLAPRKYKPSSARLLKFYKMFPNLNASNLPLSVNRLLNPIDLHQDTNSPTREGTRKMFFLNGEIYLDTKRTQNNSTNTPGFATDISMETLTSQKSQKSLHVYQLFSKYLSDLRKKKPSRKIPIRKITPLPFSFHRFIHQVGIYEKQDSFRQANPGNVVPELKNISKLIYFNGEIHLRHKKAQNQTYSMKDFPPKIDINVSPASHAHTYNALRKMASEYLSGLESHADEALLLLPRPDGIEKSRQIYFHLTGMFHLSSSAPISHYQNVPLSSIDHEYLLQTYGKQDPSTLFLKLRTLKKNYLSKNYEFVVKEGLGILENTPEIFQEVSAPIGAEWIFLTAESLKKLDAIKKARKLLNQLIQKYPYSFYATEAWLWLTQNNFKLLIPGE